MTAQNGTPPQATPPATASRGRWLANNLVTRIMAALVLAPLALAAAWFGGALWTVLAFAIAFGLYAEWLHIVGAWRASVLVSGALTLAAAVLTLWYSRPDVTALVVLLGICALIGLLKRPLRWWSAAGLCYAAAVLIASLILRGGASQGFIAIVFVFAIVWATDVLGYVVGRSVGGPKLAPRVSPNKTWSGALGSTFGSVAVAACFAAAGSGRMLPLVLLGFVLSIASQLGDLLESAVKRQFGVKDSSHIIPGHGGLLDRLDGFVAAVVAATLIGVVRGGIGNAADGLLSW